MLDGLDYVCRAASPPQIYQQVKAVKLSLQLLLIYLILVQPIDEEQHPDDRLI